MNKDLLELRTAKIGFITALPEEYVALCEVLECKTEVDVPGKGSGRKYSVSTLKLGGVETVVGVALMIDMGNNSAAIRALQMSQHCPDIEYFIMVGIAGAVPNPKKAENHVRLGDIVVSDRNGVVQYDLDAEDPQVTKHRHPPRPPGASLLEAARSLAAGELKQKRPWDSYLASGVERLGKSWKRPSSREDILRDDGTVSVGITHPKDPARLKGKPRVFHGPIASANKLLKNPLKRDALRDKFGVKAVEMEGAGIADSAWNLEKEYLVVRGTCDYCNPSKSDVWHQYAALAAAAYARTLVEAMSPIASGSSSIQTTVADGRKDEEPRADEVKPLRAKANATRHVFISYVREDSEEVDRICDTLLAAGIEVWRDKDRIAPGMPWQDAIRHAVRQGAFFMACFSERYWKRQKTFMNTELGFAIYELSERRHAQAWFIPVRLSDCAIPDRSIGLGESLSDLQCVDLFTDWADGMRRILGALTPYGSPEFDARARYYVSQEQRINRALRVYDEWHTPLIHASRIQVSNFLELVREGHLKSLPTLTEFEVSQRQSNHLSQYADHLFRLVHFFERWALVHQEGLLDQALAARLLGSYAKWYRDRLFKPLSIGETNPDFVRLNALIDWLLASDEIQKPQSPETK